MEQTYYSNGKLLITGEYVVIDGALSLAVPTSYGQGLTVSDTESEHIFWKSLDDQGHIWFESDFTIGNIEKEPAGADPTRNKLLEILKAARKLNPDFLLTSRGYLLKSTMDFPRKWGLGSSATLVNNIAQWAGVDPFQLQWHTFGGSGYDIACAKHDHPILYRLENKIPVVEEINFDPPFKNALYFVYLNRKQDSREAVARYSSLVFDRDPLVQSISLLTREITHCKLLTEFEELIGKHEATLSGILGVPTLKEKYFPGFPGALKSLGAWGGDFCLATGDTGIPAYFKALGYHTVIPYSDMVL